MSRSLQPVITLCRASTEPANGTSMISSFARQHCGLRLIVLLSTLVSLFAITPAQAFAAPSCQFVLGFAVLDAMIPQQVGQCLDNEQHNPVNGDAIQHTTGGLLVWRKADNWTAFTDGYRTWINGPYGLEERLNTQRFAWEANPDHLPVIPDPNVANTDTTAGHMIYVDLPAQSQPGTHYFYCDDDPALQSLTPGNLEVFTSYQVAQALFPGNVLHRSC
ncbi:MAG: hypothetical protein M1298_01145 [Chloroflexi bacterium]|nr:hypothetical protein [Chloroflexota bacterium]